MRRSLSAQKPVKLRKLQLKSPKFLISFAGPFWPPDLMFYSVAIYTLQYWWCLYRCKVPNSTNAPPYLRTFELSTDNKLDGSSTLLSR